MTSGITPLSHQALQTLDFSTNGRGFSRIDPALSRWIATSGIARGLLNLTCLHTSASLTINENADPRVLKDLAAWMDDMVPESRAYLHDDEGPDDMPAHIRT
ncbi:MAG: YjbQ family protein, partial [Synechococcus sp. BS307-5m-G34]|nr:YjbQ family protein [Synechococcus sp. BS307-5m-G34]